MNGTYVLDGIRYFGSCPTAPDTGRYTWVVCGTDWTTAQEVPLFAMGGVTVDHVTVNASLQGTTLSVTTTCASFGQVGTTETWGYDATPGRLTIFLPTAGGGTRTDSYRRR